MRVDVLALQRFYASPLGEAARRAAARRLTALWPHADGLDVLGLGYPTPYLGAFRASARRAVAMMPAEQGAEPWPPDGATVTALADEARLPFMDAVFDRVLMVHSLESAEQGRRLLREVWRVLADGGQALIVVPNRRGLWCLSESTPFGQGQPFSISQLKGVLRNTMFVPRESASALFVPPLRSRVILRTAVAWERVGLRWAKHFAGLLLMLAEKQIYAAPFEPAVAKRRVRAYVPVPRALAAAERIQVSPKRAGVSRAESAETAPVR